MMLIIQLVALFLVLSIVLSLIPFKRKPFVFLFSFLFAILFVIQLSSIIITGEIADYRFYENFNLTDALSVADFFGHEGLLIAGALMIVVPLIHWLGYLLRVKLRKKLLLFISLFIGLSVLSISGGIINNAYATMRLKFTGSASFTDALASLEINTRGYVLKNDIKATRGKNIIVLSLESLEKAYLEEPLKQLTPNLSSLADKHTFYSMKQCPGGSWTSGSMYTAITGVPAFFGLHGNSVFQKSYESKLTSLADVLKKAGYDLQYFIGKKEYSGIDDMLQTLGFTVKSENDFVEKYEEVDWGIQDMDLFAEFKKELLLKKGSQQPFALFLSTISTHFPDGVPDKRIDSLLPPQKSRMELMASATDFFVGKLIEFLEKEEMLSNTVFYIYPDHLLMGNKSSVLGDFGERSLYLLTNADSEAIGYPESDAIFQIDIPKIILDGAGIQHNAKFLTDYIQDSDKNAFLAKNDKHILQLNDASLKVLNCMDGIFLTLNDGKDIFEIRNSEGLLVHSGKMPDKGFCQRVLFDANLRPLTDFTIDFSKVLNDPNAVTYLDIFNTNNMLHASLKGEYHFGITKNGPNKVVFNEEDLALLHDIKLFDDVQNTIVLKSNGWNAKKPSSFSLRGKEERISRGLTLISFNSETTYEFQTFDTYGSEDDTRALLKVLGQIKKGNSKFILLAHDSAAKSLLFISESLKKLGLVKLSTLKDRQAYIGHNLEGEPFELLDNYGLKLNLSFPKKITNSNVYFRSEGIAFEPKIDRYIAHAGGTIDGLKYTNSKEAMDYSYEQGFRLFELDIIETSDGKYVAAHDWGHWAKETNFKGEVPVSREAFLKHKIRGKYTVLDMDAINSWFKTHPDAILITDKINDPKKFSAQFVGKGRLMMELFSLQAIEEASLNGVIAVCSETPLSQIKGDVVAYFKRHKVSHVALSRRNIANKGALLRKFRENDIKVYIYHVNFDPGKDEKYVFENEIGIVYGMYADQWISEFSTKKD